jgi:hypothetical protein
MNVAKDECVSLTPTPLCLCFLSSYGDENYSTYILKRNHKHDEYMCIHYEYEVVALEMGKDTIEMVAVNINNKTIVNKVMA